MADKSQKTKTGKPQATNVLETLKDIGGNTLNSFKDDLLVEGGKDFFGQFYGRNHKYSAEVIPGESLEFNDVFSGKWEENNKLKKQLVFEKRLLQEEKTRSERKTNELKLQLKAIMEEVLTLAITTQNLDEETKIAAVQAPVEPGIYHLIFFQKLLEFIKSFRRKIEDASVWLHATNKRAEKKNYWAMYKKKGSSFLLAPDHYLQRSAG